MLRKEFKCGNTIIPVDIHPEGDVNIGATGTMSAATFARLAVSVLCASNTYNDTYVGFPVCNELVDR